MGKTLFANLKETAVTDRQIALCFLGQAGFLLKLDAQRYLIIDPYFSNVCEERIGPHFKRLMPSLIDPEEVDQLGLAAYLMTHHHDDHLDSIGIAAMQKKSFPFYGPPTVARILAEIGIEEHRCLPIVQMQSFRIDNIGIHAVFADHGELAPDAVGIIIEANGKTIYHMGDTCFNAAEFEKIANRFDIDLAIVPINGKYGNMNEAEAAAAVAILHPKEAIPCHFWMLPGNSGGDVIVFLEQVSANAPDTEPLMMTQGEIHMVG